MKKVFLLIAFVYLATTYNSIGQDNNWDEKPTLGVKVGFNYSNVYDTEGESFRADSKFGLATGFFVALPIGKFLGFQPEILFSQKGYKAQGSLLGSTYTFTRTSNYIDIPLLVAVKPNESFTILAGPQYSFLLSQKNKFENGQTTSLQEEEFDNENLRRNTLCFTGGLDLNLNKVVIGARAGWDLYKNNGDGSTTTPRYKNAWYQLTFGVRF